MRVELDHLVLVDLRIEARVVAGRCGRESDDFTKGEVLVLEELCPRDFVCLNQLAVIGCVFLWKIFR